MKLFLVALWLYVSHAVCLNIILSTTDSWVSKNIRFLYQNLKDQGHDVKLVGSLYNTKEVLPSEGWEEGSELSLISQNIDDGGDFGYLLPVHQSYYKKLRRINTRNFKAKGVIPMEDIKREEQKMPVVHNKYFGRDPFDSNIWYVNSNPLNSLLVGFDVILESYYPEFKPDLLIVGPNKKNEGCNSESDSMIKVGLMKNISSIEVSLDEDLEIYFQDESYFTIQSISTDYMLRNNFVSNNIKYVNRKIGNFINNFNSNKFERKFAKLNFPKMSYDSTYCQLYSNDEYNPKFVFEESATRSNIEYTVKYPKFIFLNEILYVDKIIRESYYIRVDSSKMTKDSIGLSSLDKSRRHYDNEYSYNTEAEIEYKENEVYIAANSDICKISVDIQEMKMIESSGSVF